MGVIGIILLVLFIICSALLIVVVMLQDDQGEGLGGLFGGGGSTTPFGSRSGNVLTRFTAILGGIFIVCSFGVALTTRNAESGNVIGAARQDVQSEEGTSWWLEEAESNEAMDEAVLFEEEAE